MSWLPQTLLPWGRGATWGGWAWSSTRAAATASTALCRAGMPPPDPSTWLWTKASEIAQDISRCDWSLGAQGSELRVLILDSLRCRGEEDLLRRSVDIIQNFETIIRLHPAFGWRQAELIRMASAQARTIMLDEAALRNVGKPRPVQRGAALGPQQRAFAASASTFFIATCAAAF